MYAIFETGGKQYRVEKGDTLKVEKLPVEVGDSVEFDRVLAVGKEDGLVVGTPFIDSARVKGKVVNQGKSRKIIVFKYKPKKNYRRKQGHRQPFTQLVVEDIEV